MKIEPKVKYILKLAMFLIYTNHMHILFPLILGIFLHLVKCN